MTDGRIIELSDPKLEKLAVWSWRPDLQGFMFWWSESDKLHYAFCNVADGKCTRIDASGLRTLPGLYPSALMYTAQNRLLVVLHGSGGTRVRLAPAELHDGKLTMVGPAVALDDDPATAILTTHYVDPSWSFAVVRAAGGKAGSTPRLWSVRLSDLHPELLLDAQRRRDLTGATEDKLEAFGEDASSLQAISPALGDERAFVVICDVAGHFCTFARVRLDTGEVETSAALPNAMVTAAVSADGEQFVYTENWELPFADSGLRPQRAESTVPDRRHAHGLERHVGQRDRRSGFPARRHADLRGTD